MKYSFVRCMLCYWLLLIVLSRHPVTAQTLAIYSIKMDGTELRLHVADPKLNFGSVAVSPDGENLAFDSWPASGFDQTKQWIHVCDTNGKQMRKLSLGAMPKWSPDGDLLAFHEYLKLKGSLVIEASGEGMELVAEKKGSPFWLNNGKSIAMLDWGLGNVTFQQMSTGKQSKLRKYAIGQINHGFCISPDGTKVGFTSGRNPNLSLCIAEVNGTARPQVIHRGAICGGLSFHPDGSQIVFSEGSESKQNSDNLEPAQLFVIPIDSQGKPQRLDGTDRRELCLYPCFSPDGERIYFSSTMR